MAADTAGSSSLAQWNIDPAHTSIDFSVKHMGLFTVRGSFGKISGEVTTMEGKPTAIEASIDASSISTGNSDRDNHLRSPDFLNVGDHPRFTFKSTRIQERGKGSYEVEGDLTIHGQTHPVTLSVEAMEAIKDPFGLVRAGATATGSLSRKQWGLTYNQILETGSLLVGDEVKFTIDVQVVAAQPQL